ncbi:hypothetical protein L916_08901, partial [Phytophthora nicotianae]
GVRYRGGVSSSKEWQIAPGEPPKRSCEAVPKVIECIVSEVSKWYSYPEQLDFIDETATNGVDAIRRYAWSRKVIPEKADVSNRQNKNALTETIQSR